MSEKKGKNPFNLVSQNPSPIGWPCPMRSGVFFLEICNLVAGPIGQSCPTSSGVCQLCSSQTWFGYGPDRASFFFLPSQNWLRARSGEVARPDRASVSSLIFVVVEFDGGLPDRASRPDSIGRSHFSCVSGIRCGPDRAGPPDDLGLCSNKQCLEFLHELLQLVTTPAHK